jgi:hypothetical protein
MDIHDLIFEICLLGLAELARYHPWLDLSLWAGWQKNIQGKDPPVSSGLNTADWHREIYPLGPFR